MAGDKMGELVKPTPVSDNPTTERAKLTNAVRELVSRPQGVKVDELADVCTRLGSKAKNSKTL